MKIAVIVPVYNGEKFLPDFLACLARQTGKNFEVFFVDDCSTDRTGMLLREAAARYAGFHYLRNDTRCGAAFSRNRGIDHSQSEYVLCLDADDCIADDLLEQLERAAETYGADMVMLERGDFVKADTIDRDHAFFKDEAALYENTQGGTGKRVFRLADQPADFLLRCQNGTCDRMVKRALLDRYGIRFQNLPSSNDVFYALFSVFAAKRIVHTETSDFLYYRRNHSQPGRISNDRDPMCAYEALKAVKDALVQNRLWAERCVYFWIFALDSLEKQLFVCRREERRRQVLRYLQEEGFCELGVPDDPRYDRLPETYRRQFALFLTIPYEENCFKDSMSFRALCESRRERIAAVFDYAEKNGLRVGYWGVGRMTEGFLSVTDSLEKKVDFLIDNDQKKQGKRLFGTEIVSYDRAKEQVGLVIISNRQYYREIRKQIRDGKEKAQVLSIQEYLYCDGSVGEYIR